MDGLGQDRTMYSRKRKFRMGLNTIADGVVLMIIVNNSKYCDGTGLYRIGQYRIGDEQDRKIVG